MDGILDHLDKERWISFSKDDSAETFKARDKLRAYGLIEEYKRYSWRLTKDGYKAIELGGFEKWYENENKGRHSEFTQPQIKVDNLSIVTGNKNNINQSKLDNSPKSVLTTDIKSNKENKRSWLEITGWIVGILAGLIAIYEFWLKNLLTN